MAEYPCDFHLARYAGPSNRVYINVYREEEKICLKASICPHCLAALLSDSASRCLYQGPAGAWDPLDEGVDLEGLWQPAGRASGPLNGYRRR